MNKEKGKELKGLQSAKILIPEKIICDTTINKYRVAVLVYLCCRTGFDYKIDFSIGRIVEWLGKCEDRHILKNGNNAASGIKECLERFRKENYFSYDKELKYANIVEGKFDREEYGNSISGERFAKIYIDELMSIINYQTNKDEISIDNSILLLVFAYLRMKIPVKNNLAGAAERPDAYDTHYKIIGAELGLSERLVSRAVKILIDMGLIYEFRREKETYYLYDDKGDKIKKYKEKTFIFCNTYKRIDKNGKTYLVNEGERYYIKEANNKEAELIKMEQKIKKSN